MLRTVLAAALFVTASPALAASSDWITVEGGAVRVVTGAAGDEAGMRGALEIRLAPGWKTYWRDPGDAGVPPAISVATPAEGASVTARFPAPQRFDDGYSTWAGYAHSVSLPLDFEIAEPAAHIAVSVFLGICESICIPLQARLEVSDPTRATPEELEAIAAAYAVLPADAHDGFRARLVEAEADTLVIEATVPKPGSATELFVASGENWALGTPVRRDASTFEVPVLDGPAAGSAAESVHYTLETPDGAVSGLIDLQR